MHRIFITIAVSALLVSGIAAAEILPSLREGNSFWGVGDTGILCYRPPCPWRGVFPIDREGKRGRPLSSDNQPEPPNTRASAADRARLERTYAEGRCLLVEGRFDGSVLIIDGILGDCPFRPRHQFYDRGWAPSPLQTVPIVQTHRINADAFERFRDDPATCDDFREACCNHRNEDRRIA